MSQRGRSRNKSSGIVKLTVMLALSGVSYAAYAESGSERLRRSTRSQMNAVSRCYLASAALFARKTCEPPDTVVEAAYGKCAREEQNLSRRMIEVAPSLNGGLTDSYIAGARSGAKGFMLQVILHKRKAGRCLRSPSSLP